VVFDLVEHQVVYDGQHNLEKTDDLTTVCIQNLPPGDSVTVSFVIPSTNLAENLGNIFKSARSKECVRKIREKNVSDSIGKFWFLSVGAIVVAFTVGIGQGYLTSNLLGVKKLQDTVKSPQSIIWKLKVPKSAARGKYKLEGELSGSAFGEHTQVRSSTIIEVR
jgi:hypothetical protein